MSTILEGTMPYRSGETYFRIVEPNNPSDKPPLLCIHGGPGSTHNYFEVFDELADRDNRTIVMYDQIGCGNSYLEGMHPTYWTLDLWLEELIRLRKHLKLDKVHMLGQSWGGMLMIAYAVDREPQGIMSYILSSTNPSTKMWKEEANRRIRMMTREDQAAISVYLDGYTDESDPGYIHAVSDYMSRYCYPNIRPDLPDCITRPKRVGKESYESAWGVNEFLPTGPLARFEYLDKLKNIPIDCMVCSGVQDLCSPLIAKAMHDRLAYSQWNLYPHSHHLCFIDDYDQYTEDLVEWLNAHDA